MKICQMMCIYLISRFKWQKGTCCGARNKREQPRTLRRHRAAGWTPLGHSRPAAWRAPPEETAALIYLLFNFTTAHAFPQIHITAHSALSCNCPVIPVSLFPATSRKLLTRPSIATPPRKKSSLLSRHAQTPSRGIRTANPRQNTTMSNAPTLINLPPPPSDPVTPSDIP